MSPWQNPPQPGFSVDPSVAPALRPSTSDRDYADSTTAGQVAGQNMTMMPVAAMPPIVNRLDPARRNAQLVLGRSLIGWLGLAVLFNVIWLFSSGIGSYYWPIWPMLGTAVPLIGLVVARFGPDPAPVRRETPPTDLR